MTLPTMHRDLLEWRWRYGGPRDFWISRRDVVEELIKANELRALDRIHFVFDDPVPISVAFASQIRDVAEVAKRIPWPRPFPGGLRIPHVHFGDEVFELNREQWKDFSQQIVKDFAERLQRAGAVDFTKMMDLAEGMAGV